MKFLLWAALLLTLNCAPAPRRYFLVCWEPLPTHGGFQRKGDLLFQEVPDSLAGVRLAWALVDSKTWQSCATWVVR